MATEQRSYGPDELDQLFADFPVPESTIRAIQTKLARKIAEDYLAEERRVAEGEAVRR